MCFRGFPMYEGVEQPEIKTSWTMVLVGVAVGLLVSAFLVFTLYRQRWYIRCSFSWIITLMLLFFRFYWFPSLRYHLLRKKVNREGPFACDAFISYAKEDETWVMVSAMKIVSSKLMMIYYGSCTIIGWKFWFQDQIVPQMEAEGVKLCLHTRDFQVTNHHHQ